MRNGKGSKQRPTNFKSFYKNYDRISWGHPRVYCCECGNSIGMNDVDDHPKFYILYEDGTIAHQNCNYN